MDAQGGGVEGVEKLTGGLTRLGLVQAENCKREQRGVLRVESHCRLRCMPHLQQAHWRAAAAAAV